MVSPPHPVHPRGEVAVREGVGGVRVDRGVHGVWPHEPPDPATTVGRWRSVVVPSPS